PDQAAVPTREDRDGHLVEALRRCERAAAERVVATYGDRAYRLAVGITGTAEDAEEVVQDAFWTVIRKIDTFRGESAFGSWLYRTVLILHDVEGLSHIEAAESLGLSVPNVKSRVHRARLFLRKRLADVHGGLRGPAG